MKGREKLIAGMVLGAGAMYLLDPDRGGRRRSLLRDQGVHISHKVGAGLATKARHTGNRTLGAAAELRSRLRHAEKTEEALQALMRDTCCSSSTRAIRARRWKPRRNGVVQ